MSTEIKYETFAEVNPTLAKEYEMVGNHAYPKDYPVECASSGKVFKLKDLKPSDIEEILQFGGTSFRKISEVDKEFLRKKEAEEAEKKKVV